MLQLLHLCKRFCRHIRPARILSNWAIYLVNVPVASFLLPKNKKEIGKFTNLLSLFNLSCHYLIVSCVAFNQPVFEPICPTYHSSLPISAVDVGLNISPANGFIVGYNVLRVLPFGRV